MLTYYSYFSVGGYKDFMLGNSQSSDKATFYLPLLPVLEERAQNDKNIAKQVEELKSLPSIKVLSGNNSYGLPEAANVLFSHAGYKLIYRHLENDKHAIALRDITPESKDENGRSIPFLFVIVGDDKEDVHVMDCLASFMVSNIREVESLLIHTLYMDKEKNGLRFDLAEFNKWMKHILSSSMSTIVPTLSGGIKVVGEYNKVALLLLPEGITEQNAIMEQKINNRQIISVSSSEIISKEDPDKLVEMLMEVSNQLKDEKKRNAMMKKGMIAAGVGGFVIGGFIAGCLHK